MRSINTLKWKNEWNPRPLYFRTVSSHRWINNTEKWHETQLNTMDRKYEQWRKAVMACLSARICRSFAMVCFKRRWILKRGARTCTSLKSTPNITNTIHMRHSLTPTTTITKNNSDPQMCCLNCSWWFNHSASTLSFNSFIKHQQPHDHRKIFIFMGAWKKNLCILDVFFGRAFLIRNT